VQANSRVASLRAWQQAGYQQSDGFVTHITITQHGYKYVWFYRGGIQVSCKLLTRYVKKITNENRLIEFIAFYVESAT